MEELPNGKEFLLLVSSAVVGGLTSLYIQFTYKPTEDFFRNISFTMIANIALYALVFSVMVYIVYFLVKKGVGILNFFAIVFSDIFLRPLRFIHIQLMRFKIYQKLCLFFKKFNPDAEPEEHDKYTSRYYFPNKHKVNFGILLLFLVFFLYFFNILLLDFGSTKLIILVVIMSCYLVIELYGILSKKELP